MPAIQVRGVSKAFRIPHERTTTLLERVLGMFRSSQVAILQAVQDVSFEVPKGSFVGVIGSNGSGKSTLLKLMAGVLKPDDGSITVDGHLVPLLELGLGFHQELSVRENVALYGAVLGYPPAEMARRIDEVIAFAELEEFRDAKLKSLSSGMMVRLAFATAIRADADILLLDEVMAVGDAQFQRKCIETFEALQRQQKTIVLVSHDLASVQRFCDRAFWLDRGRIVMSGDPAEVVQTYLTVMKTSPVKPELLDAPEDADHRWGDGTVRFADIQLRDADDRRADAFRAGTRAVLHVDAEVHSECADPVFGIIIWLGGQVIYSTNTVLLGQPLGRLTPGEHLHIEVPFTVGLANGHYSLTVAVANPRDGTVYDWINHLVTFSVDGSCCGEGVADLGAELHVTRSPGARGADVRRLQEGSS